MWAFESAVSFEAVFTCLLLGVLSSFPLPGIDLEIDLAEIRVEVEVLAHPSDGNILLVAIVFNGCGWRAGGVGGSGRFLCLKSLTETGILRGDRLPTPETETDEPVDKILDPVDVVDEADVEEMDTMDDAIELKSMDKVGFFLAP